MTRLALFLIFLSFGIFAQGGAKVEDSGKHDPLRSQSIEDTEKSLNKQVLDVDKLLQNHTKLFRTKIDVLPAKTVFYKGKAGKNKAGEDDCIENADKDGQIAKDNNCMKVEVYDFHRSEDGLSELNLGSKNKSIILFYAGGASGDDPKAEPPQAVKMIRTRVYHNNFVEEDLKITDVTDEAPDAATDAFGGHDDKTSIFYQHDNLPARGTKEDLSKRGYGLYKVASMDNNKLYPTRNEFKQGFYVKSLRNFDKLFAAILDYNERHQSKRYKESTTVLKSSLKY